MEASNKFVQNLLDLAKEVGEYNQCQKDKMKSNVSVCLCVCMHMSCTFVICAVNSPVKIVSGKISPILPSAFFIVGLHLNLL